MVIRSKQRFIATVIIILVAVIVFMLSIIYFTTQVKIDEENKDMLELFATQYAENGLPASNLDAVADVQAEDISTDEPQEVPETSDTFHRYQVSTFYAVIFDEDNQFLEMLNDAPSEHSDEELQELAKQMIGYGEEYGSTGEIVYLVTTTDEYTLVTMMDNSVVGQTITTLMRTMIVFGAITIVIIIIFSALLGKWVMKPVEESYNRQKQFVSDAGHELKTPIATIGANAEILKRQVGENEWLDNIEYENNRMSLIVYQLLDLARMEQVKMQMEEVDLSRLCIAAILPFEATAFEQDISLNYDIPEGFFLQGERQKLEQLVSILVDNAISHCKEKGNVSITLSESKGRSVLRVTNDGAPIPEEEREHIFERFYRSDRARVDKTGHYGLGLSIARSIAVLHKGSIFIECSDGQVSFVVVL
ncbi:MAG: HAMP domain-containing histidine kinase [Eubacterium sp.]|nr:HAMP domain-containing histidine kinase [Eubacterium sp.]